MSSIKIQMLSLAISILGNVAAVFLGYILIFVYFLFIPSWYGGGHFGGGPTVPPVAPLFEISIVVTFIVLAIASSWLSGRYTDGILGKYHCAAMYLVLTVLFLVTRLQSALTLCIMLFLVLVSFFVGDLGARSRKLKIMSQSVQSEKP